VSAVAIGVIGLYLLIVLGIGYYGYRTTKRTPQEYFLAGGTLGWVVFPLTMFATLMSAFIFLGSAGWGYTHGLAWMALLGIEAVAGIPLALIGLRAWRKAQRHDYVTPTGLLGGTFDSDTLKLSVMGIQLAWGVPYVAIQALGGGLLLETISSGSVPFWAGALAVTLVTAVYLSLGGLRGVAWTDVLQGLTLVVMLVAAGVYILPRFDPVALTDQISTQTDLLTTAGAVGLFTPRVWFSFALMNAMAILAYPQMFQRFFAAKNERSFRALMLWWPVMVLVAAVVPVLLGVWGTELVPGLSNPDLVIPALLQEFAPPVVVGIVLGGAVAAMMSTADSLVLTLSSLVAHDLYRDHLADRVDADSAELWVSRATTGLLLLAGYVMALAATGRIPGVPSVGSIIDLAVYFIQGNALLLPVFLAALYWPRATATGAIASVAVGQGYFAIAAFDLAPLPVFGFTPFVPALALAIVALVGGSLVTTPTTDPAGVEA
jgi:SSS family solute:Na+ symporter